MASAGSAAVDAYSRPADHRRGFPSAATRRRQLADNCRGGAPAARRRLAGGSDPVARRRGGALRRSQRHGHGDWMCNVLRCTPVLHTPVLHRLVPWLIYHKRTQ
jgi:hypothetical protein